MCFKMKQLSWSSAASDNCPVHGEVLGSSCLRSHWCLLGSLPPQPVLCAPASCWANNCSWNVWPAPLLRPSSTLHRNTFEIPKCDLYTAVNVQKSFFGLVSKVFGKHHCCILRIKEVPIVPPAPQTVQDPDLFPRPCMHSLALFVLLPQTKNIANSGDVCCVLQSRGSFKCSQLICCSHAAWYMLEGALTGVLVSAAAGNKSATRPPLPPPACGGE